MARQREVGTLWIGGALSWMEALCLKSFVDAGQAITLFSYHDIPNVPDGVLRRDGREVLPAESFLKYEKKDSFALFADLFRLHMLRACPGMIWVDTDVYCHRPMTYDDDHVFGVELQNSLRLNNAVLGLPADSPVLADMIAYTSDPHAIPPFVRPKLREEYEAARQAGSPVHVSQQPWGVWGPMMLSHFMQKHGQRTRAQPVDAFYPVTFPDRMKFLRPARVVAGMLTANTTALHLWASNKRELGLRHGGLVPEGSYFDLLCQRHAIRPDAAPIRTRGRRVFDAGLLDALGLDDGVTTFADLGGASLALAAAAHARWGCDVFMIDMDRKGKFGGAVSATVAPWRAGLAEQGVPQDRIHVIRAEADLRPFDVIANLSGFGDVWKAGGLAPVLGRCLHPGTRLISDIRKGSGSYPLLNAHGSTETLSVRDEEGATVTRVLFRPHPPAIAAEDSWPAIATGLAGKDGFFQAQGQHSFLFLPRGRTLVVTFDNLDIAMTKREERRPWGFEFIEKQGWSMLGVMADGWTWYRDPWVCDQFARLAAEGFFARFDRVVFYGASMGGYAAAAFSAACPGADVVAISPQSTLDRALVPWETRYSAAWGRDFGGAFGDAAAASAAAGRVFLLYDPYERLDAGHADRFQGTNVVKLRTPLMGHRLGSSLRQMGILNPIIVSALNGSLTEHAFYQALRARRSFPRYQRELFKRALDRGHPDLARALGRWVLTRGDNRYIRLGLQTL